MVMHLACPRVEYLDREKSSIVIRGATISAMVDMEKDDFSLADVLTSAVTDVTAKRGEAERQSCAASTPVPSSRSIRNGRSGSMTP